MIACHFMGTPLALFIFKSSSHGREDIPCQAMLPHNSFSSLIKQILQITTSAVNSLPLLTPLPYFHTLAVMQHLQIFPIQTLTLLVSSSPTLW